MSESPLRTWQALMVLNERSPFAISTVSNEENVLANVQTHLDTLTSWGSGQSLLIEVKVNQPNGRIVSHRWSHRFIHRSAFMPSLVQPEFRFVILICPERTENRQPYTYASVDAGLFACMWMANMRRHTHAHGKIPKGNLLLSSSQRTNPSVKIVSSAILFKT